ncbi:hypothetical protein P8452_60499 [Trifolium repens]|nr:hypothetical protein P8452_60499 [Trifolium repens]
MRKPADNRLKLEIDGTGTTYWEKNKKNRPRRPPSAFLLFIEVQLLDTTLEGCQRFRKEGTYSQTFFVTACSKIAGAEWKSMSNAEKAPYMTKAKQERAVYEKFMQAYNIELSLVLRRGTLTRSSTPITISRNFSYHCPLAAHMGLPKVLLHGGRSFMPTYHLDLTNCWLGLMHLLCSLLVTNVCTGSFPTSKTKKASKTRKVLEIPSSPSTSSADESLSSAEIQGVQSKPCHPQATATSTQSFDSGQVVKIPSSEDESASSKDESTSSEGGSTSSEDGSTSSKDESLLSAEVQAVQSKPFGPQATDTLTQSFESGQKVLSAMEVKPLPTSDPVVSVSDTVMADPQTNVSRSVDVVMKDQAVIPEEMVTMGGPFQKVDYHQDPTEDLVHQVKQECTGDTDPADDLLSLLTDSSPAASAFSGPSSTTAWLNSSDSEAMELFKELKRLVSKPFDVASADTSAFDHMRRLVEELKPLKQRLPLSSQSTLEQVNNFLSLHASKNAFLTATLPVYEQAVNSKEDLVKKILPLKEQKDEIAVNRKQQEAAKVKAKEKVDQLKKQLALAEAELAEANTGIAVLINLEKKRVDSINALRGEVNQTAEILRNLQSDYELAVWTKKELEDLWLKIT